MQAFPTQRAAQLQKEQKLLREEGEAWQGQDSTSGGPQRAAPLGRPGTDLVSSQSSGFVHGEQKASALCQRWAQLR